MNKIIFSGENTHLHINMLRYELVTDSINFVNKPLLCMSNLNGVLIKINCRLIMGIYLNEHMSTDIKTRNMSSVWRSRREVYGKFLIITSWIATAVHLIYTYKSGKFLFLPYKRTYKERLALSELEKFPNDCFLWRRCH